MKGSPLKVWSIRTEAELDTLLSGQPLRTDPSRIDPDFARPDAYHWMARQLAEKVAPPEGIVYPIWVWQCWSGPDRVMPDLRARGHVAKGQAAVRLTLDIPKQLLLLSDFDTWHCVLNHHYNAVNDEDYQAFEAYLAGETDKSAIEQKIEQSWLKIFDIDHLLTHWPNQYSIQGVTWEILPEYLLGYQRFIGR
ncbi:MAG: DUF3841 domain-containing protein [Psychrobacter sp.]|nr:DUF3841 domain-containing protein [Psychrobacter sp.]